MLHREHAGPARQRSRRTAGVSNKSPLKEQRTIRVTTNRSFLSLSRFAGFWGSSIAYSTGLPSRRAGGGFGHPVRVVLPRIGVMPRVYVVRHPICPELLHNRRGTRWMLASVVHTLPRFSKRGCFLVDKCQKRSTATSICWRNSYLCLTI